MQPLEEAKRSASETRAEIDAEVAGEAVQEPPIETGSGSALDVRAILALALRTLPYLRPYLREIRPMLIVVALLSLIAVPATMLATDMLLTRMLGAEPLTPFQASLLRLDSARFVDVEQLGLEARQILRSRLLRDVIIVGAVLTPLGVWMTYVIIRLVQRINQRLRVEMIEQLQSMSLRFHSGTKVGDSVYRAYQDSAMVTNLMGMLVRPIPALLLATVGLLLCLLFDWRLSLGLLALYGSAYLLARAYTARLRADFRRARERNSALTSRIQESLAGIRVIKAHGAEALEQERFETASREAFAAAYVARTRFALFGILAFCLAALPPLVASAYLAVLAGEGRPLAAGMALAFLGFASWNLGAYGDATRRVGSYARASRRLLHMWAQVQDMAVGMERAISQVDLDPEVKDDAEAVAFPGLEDVVRFRGVRFGYAIDHPVLTDIDLEARAGTITALVGPTGSGKSTLGALLLRLFDPDEGVIEIDGLDIRRIALESLRANISVALQENLLFGTTIEENIRYAAAGADAAAVREAARVACADEFIEQQPEGYATRLGERGAKLSTGQRQRLSIARAIVKDSPILILDEPTASLDADTELRVMRNLAEWGAGRAIFLVTHRLSTIQRADRIVYLADGRILEQGSHAELMAREDGRYRRMVELEQAAAARAGGGT